MKRNLWDPSHKCISCNASTKKKKLIREGLSIRGWECRICKETVLHPDDAQKMLIFNRLRKRLPAKIGELGQSLIVNLPKEIVESYKINNGEAKGFVADGCMEHKNGPEVRREFIERMKKISKQRSVRVDDFAERYGLN